MCSTSCNFIALRFTDFLINHPDTPTLFGLFLSRYELTSSEYVEKLPEGKHSTKGLGRTAPDPSGNYTTKEGMVIPMGPGNSSSVLSTALLYNEYP